MIIDTIRVRVIRDGKAVHESAYVSFRGLALPAIYRLAFQYPEGWEIDVARVGGQLTAAEQVRVVEAIEFARKQAA